MHAIPRRRFLALAAGAYRAAEPGYRYEFPRDHFEHPDFRTEWWYYTGNLRDPRGRPFGFELVFFRQAVERPAPSGSVWRPPDLYLAHLALTDIAGQRFIAHKRLNRPGPGVAGASFEQRRVWNGNWSAAWQEPAQILTAIAPEFRFRFTATPIKQPYVHGLNGVSQKAGGAGKASHYVSFTRLAVEGDLSYEDSRFPVEGLAWMDHEWFTHQLESEQAGWDWFSIQLEDGRDLMLFQLRRKDGSIDPYSAGSVIFTDGRGRHLRREQFTLEPLRLWTSPKTGTRYPVEWRISVPGERLDLRAAAAVDGQELADAGAAGINYWEGAVRYEGSARGAGYLEMTGYDKPVNLG
ncbi:MAG: carotenoid 1,2-hydratase [Bryobacterales bacterium]|nr:carotenoid 1,2-hydratase [Bryobacterales bacterium]